MRYRRNTIVRIVGILLLWTISRAPAQIEDQPAPPNQEPGIAVNSEVRPAVQKSRVYYAMDSNVLGPSRSVQPRIVRRMVESLVCGVTGKSTTSEAWRSLVSPEDKVGIKVSASGRSVSGTNPEVVAAVVEGLREAGVPEKNIIVWDRNLEDLLAAGYRKEGDGYQLRWVDAGSGYDSKAQVSAPVLGKLIWGDRKFGEKSVQRFSDMLSGGEQLSSQSYYAKVLSTEVTKVINIPSLTDSYTTGINGALVNMTLANLDNWRRFAKSAADGDSYIAEIYADAPVREKVVLTIMDSLILQYAGGPFPNPDFAVENYALFAGKDPVAIDATALRLIEEMRKTNKMPSVKPMTAYIEAGAQLGLGDYLEHRIEMVRVGVEGIR
ncbi:MAG: DUF362 domain-containing protein [Terrimicrobiaceae bacterium]